MAIFFLRDFIASAALGEVESSREPLSDTRLKTAFEDDRLSLTIPVETLRYEGKLL